MRAALVAALVVLGLAPAAHAGGVLLAGAGDDPAAVLRAANSSASLEPGRGRHGGAAIAWRGIRWRSRLEFLRAGSADFAAVDRVSLWIHSGGLQGESLTLVAADDRDHPTTTFAYPVMLTWEGWKAVEVALLRFVRDGTGLWPQMKSLALDYGGRKEGGEVFLDEVRLLAPGESGSSGPPRPAGAVSVLLGDFEDKVRGLAAWVPRDSAIEVSADEVRCGQWALRWSRVRKGSSLEALRTPFSLEGCDRFAAWIRSSRPVAGGLHVAFGNDAGRIAFCPVGPLPAGWSEVVLPLSKFRSRGEVDRSRVEHFALLYEGDEETAFVLDDVRFLGEGGPAAPPPPGPGPDRAVVLDARGNAVLAGPGSDVRPEAAGSRAARTSESWYTREGRPSILWTELGASSTLAFPNVPADASAYSRIEAWVYSDNPTGRLAVALAGDRGEIAAEIPVDWIGWKRVDLPLEGFRGGRPTAIGKWERLVFRFEGRKEDLREFCFDEIRAVKK